MPAKKQHRDQVLPIEDVEQILGFTNSVTRVACVCRIGIYGPEPRLCYGCGICRAHCAHDAISLSDRQSVPAVANLW